MSKHKRHVVQPRLEPMEDRVVPSASGVQALHKEAVAAHLSQIRDSAQQAKATQLAKKDGAMSPQHIEHLKLIATKQQTETAAQQTGGVTGFFQSLFKNL
jgi:hypothetical protein